MSSYAQGPISPIKSIQHVTAQGLGAGQMLTVSITGVTTTQTVVTPLGTNNNAATGQVANVLWQLVASNALVVQFTCTSVGITTTGNCDLTEYKT